MTPTGLVVLGGIAAGIGYLVWSWHAPPARVPDSVVSRWSFTARGDLRSVGKALHAAWKANLVAKWGDDPAEARRRLLAAAETGLVTCGGVASPPGPVRLILEERKKGDHPGRRLHAVLTRADGQVHVELRGVAAGIFPLPRRICEAASRELTAAVAAIDEG